MSLTRVAPSRLVPGANGVFLTRAVKKLTPIEVAPLRDAIAPPYMVNLIHTPSHTISLRRFLALRHQFSTGLYFNIATARGWYLLVPSHHAPLADAAGLQAWRDRHHYRYLAGKREKKNNTDNHNNNNNNNSVLEQSVSTTATTTNGTRKLDNESDFCKTEEEDGDNNNNNNDFDDDDNDDYHYSSSDMERIGKYSSGSLTTKKTSHPLSQRPQLHISPLTIAEDHLFEINDGILWEIPPRDDLANCEYWKMHRERMQLYEDTNSGKSEEELLTMSQSIDGERESKDGVIKKDQYMQMQQILRALTRKANVRLEVDDNTHLLTLVPIVNLKEGDELFLHYGREWWSQRLLSSVFMSVSDAEMRNVRWIESLFMEPTDVAKPFPLLCSAIAKKKHNKKNKKNSEDKTEKERVNEMSSSSNISRVESEGKLVLYNIATQRKATDTESLVFALRRSCVNQDFFTRLVGAHGTGVFDVSRCDDEIPLRQLRRVLLASLREEQLSQSTGISTTATRRGGKEREGEGEEEGGLRVGLKKGEDEEDDGSLVL
ncbi:uncharacterized protein TM35_000122560 [Trypanosoma theileri]|uniref:SET domain-containing protein n=1 Tax=Trypanosoma theileri TaxID=67003 RepID=A0A1X0NXZ3_9TRYP|nr:uncharacterized protein TM35_000122560 [Trypanosoma theileri]ORC89481.1 hypothetical protein TM35_000122560 [Trypanosoma theileri]